MGRRRCWRCERLGSMTNGNNYGPASPSPPKIHLQTLHAPHSNLVWKLPSVFCLPLQISVFFRKTNPIFAATKTMQLPLLQRITKANHLWPLEENEPNLPKAKMTLIPCPEKHYGK